MVIVFVLPALLLICAIFFCIKDWYGQTLKESEDRRHFFEKYLGLVLFLPLVLQAACLFCYALGQSIALCYALSYFIESNILKNETYDSGIFDPLKIIYSGSLLLTLQYLLLKSKPFESKVFRILSKTILCLGSILLLRELIANMLQSVLIPNSNAPEISYSNDFIWMLCLLLILTLTIVKGAWIYDRELHSLQYLALTSRILICYTLFIILTAMPGIIKSVTTYLTGNS